ncbi:MAG: type II toxin-antitoxin system Phd/YefM family antitoxin [Chloroflexi bacterium]|nr:type II toxin-antitoxin system Phd/YefM family antitoxin [Chloroflexota bacterium]
MIEETTYSIAEARNQFTAIVRNTEESSQPVHVTRRGQPAVVILSAEEYARLLANQPKQDFWRAFLEYKEKWQDEPMDIEEDIWQDVRDKSAGREVNSWH